MELYRRRGTIRRIAIHHRNIDDDFVGSYILHPILIASRIVRRRVFQRHTSCGNIEHRHRSSRRYSFYNIRTLGILYLTTNHYGTQHITARIWHTYSVFGLGDYDSSIRSIAQCGIHQDGA